MTPSKIQDIIQEVRLGDKNTLDFKNAVTSYLIDTYELNEIQSSICFKKSESHNCNLETIFIRAEEHAIFARKILKNR